MEFILDEVVILNCFSKEYPTFKKGTKEIPAGTSYNAEMSLNGAYLVVKTNDLVFKKLNGEKNKTVNASFKLNVFKEEIKLILVGFN